MDIIRLRQLHKSYGKARGIVDVTFDVRSGEMFGFIGPNGAGKSTTIRSLLGYIRPDGGTAEVFGMDCRRESVAIRRRTGYLPSEVYFTDERKARQVLGYAASFYPGDLRGRIGTLAERLDVDLEKRMDAFSFGNRKKVAIIQALMHSPELLLLDEPTAGLDPLIQREFFDILREERDRGATVLFSSHVLPEVQRHCDRVAVIREGRALFVKPVAELLTQNVKRVTVALKTGETREYVFGGDINELTRALAEEDLANLLVEEPPLEEVFLSYYRKEGA